MVPDHGLQRQFKMTPARHGRLARPDAAPKGQPPKVKNEVVERHHPNLISVAKPENTH